MKILTTKEVDHWWRCPLCYHQFEANVKSIQYRLKGYLPPLCEKCVADGILWAIRKSTEERLAQGVL